MSPVQSFSLARSAVDILLAAEKDALYEGEVKKELQNFLERIIGHRSVAQLLPEISALSSFLYYCLSLRLPICLFPNQSNYLPFQTLGEESCYLARVSVKDLYRSTDGTHEQKENYIPVVSTNVGCRLWLSVVSAHLCTYIIERSRLGWINLMYVSMTPRNRLEQQLRQHQTERGVTGSTENREISNVQPPLSFPVRASICILKRFDVWRDSFRAWSRALENGISGDLSTNFIEGLVDWLRKCHLAIFYIAATYLAIPSRLCKIQYMFTSDPTQSNVRQSRPNLSILGYILFIRLLVPLTVKSTQILRKWKQNKRRSATSEMRFASAVSSRMQATTRVPGAIKGSKDITMDDIDSHRKRFTIQRQVQRKCSLCLEPRISPAITPCGHVFCWECIVGWCQKNKTECPLCRQEVLPQQIRSLYGYN